MLREGFLVLRVQILDFFIMASFSRQLRFGGSVLFGGHGRAAAVLSIAELLLDEGRRRQLQPRLQSS